MMLSRALHYADLGYRVFPLVPGGKTPVTAHGFKDATTDPDTIRAWWTERPDANIGLAAVNFTAADIDTKHGIDGHASWASLLTDVGAGTPEAWSQDTPSGGRHYLFRYAPALRNRAGFGGSKYPGLDLRSTNGYIVAAPSVVDGKPYVACVEDLPRPQDLTPLPDELRAFLLPKPKPSPAPRVPADPDTPLTAYGRRAVNALLVEAREAPAGTRNDTWARVAARVGSLSAQGHVLREQALSVMLTTADECGDDPTKTHDTIRRCFDHGHTETGGGPPRDAGQSAAVGDRPHNDTGLADRFLRDHADDVRYAPGLGWFVWSGTRWERDERDAVTERAKATAEKLRRETQADPLAPPEARRLAMRAGDRRRITDLLALAASDPRVRVDVGTFDPCPWLLNVENGTLDLRSGELREHRREDFITGLAPVVFDPTASAPRWLRFLVESQPDAEVREYLRRWAGYCATGEMREQVFHLHHGAGANGKSTFEHLLRSVLGDYAGTAAFDTFLARRTGQATNDLAALAGKRFIVASEPEEGARLSESVVKLVTGEDPLTVRRLYREWFTFTPAFKLLLTGNHRPRIRGGDHAIWRRVRLVPWSMRFEGARKNPNLRRELEAEAPGVLAWVVAGAVTYFREGLRPPAQVLAATGEYQTGEDVLHRFVEDTCRPDPQGAVSNGDLRHAYESWCEREGESASSARALAERLRDAGYLPVKDTHGIRGRGWGGLALVTEAPR